MVTEGVETEEERAVEDTEVEKEEVVQEEVKEEVELEEEKEEADLVEAMEAEAMGVVREEEEMVAAETVVEKVVGLVEVGLEVEATAVEEDLMGVTAGGTEFRITTEQCRYIFECARYCRCCRPCTHKRAP